MKIEVIGDAKAYDAVEQQITAVAPLRKLDGITHPGEVVSDHIEFAGVLDEAGVTGGTVSLRYNGAKKALEVVCTFEAPQKLNTKQSKALLAETSGQLSDGIGEGCFDPVKGHRGIFVDVFPLAARTPLRLKQTGTAKATPKKQANIWAAASKGELDKVAQALAAGADINGPKKGELPLHLAVLAGQTDVVELLLERGADVHSRDNTDFTALHSCIASAGIKTPKIRAKLLEILIAAGADVNAASCTAGKPLPMARNYRRGEKIVALLHAHGATD